jgi:hypothetical protein
MILYGVVGGLAFLGLLFLVFSVKAMLWERWGAAFARIFVGFGFLAAAGALGFVGFALTSYQRLTDEQSAAEVQIRKHGDRHYTAMVTYPSKAFQVYDLYGDEWQIDARVLQWHGLARVLGFDAMYRLERISGRYGDIASEKSEKRTVHALAPPERYDIWELAKGAKQWMPWVDALYGSAVFLPMADNTIFEVRVSPTGLVARPVNDEAKKAVGGWK